MVKQEKIGDRQIRAIKKAMRVLRANERIGRDLTSDLGPAILVLSRELLRLEHGYDQDKLTDQDVTDIATSAFEGGITYWCNSVTIVGKWPEGAKYASDTLVLGGKLKLHDFESERDVILTADKLRQGIILRAAKRGRSVKDWVEDHDAGEADCAVQLAVFGEVVYG